PVLCGAAQTKSLPGYVSTRQSCGLAVIDGHMAVGGEASRGLRGLIPQPFLSQSAAPDFRLTTARAQRAQFAAQGAYLRDAVQPHELAPFTGGLVSQGFQRGDPSQGHEGEQKKDAFQRGVALRDREELAAVSQQTVLQQCRQCQKHTTRGHVLHSFELHRRPVEHAHRRLHPLQSARGRPAQRCLAIRYAALTRCPPRAVSRPPAFVFFLPRLCSRPARIALCSVLVRMPSWRATSGTSSPSSSNPCASTSSSGVSLLPRRRDAGAKNARGPPER